MLDVEFGGETVTFYGSVSDDGTSMERSDGYNLIGNLPYTVGDTKAYFVTLIQTQLGVENPAPAIPDDCRASVEEVTRRITESLRVNEETTVAEKLEEEWDEPP
ncbi:hypothetical protein BRD00_07120 [Halobacteriales archaeon QS_8_69_26]|nr:MAG: hypothetical protein BRD00_07120 [Halobacteriales archaeon QS_8_69_26]